MSSAYDTLIQSYRERVTGLLDDLQTRFAELDRYVAEIESLQAKVQSYKQDFSSALQHVQVVTPQPPLSERMNGIVSEGPLPPTEGVPVVPQVDATVATDDRFGSLKAILGDQS